MVSEVLAEVLRRRREDFNARFERARHVLPQLEGERLFEFVREVVDPIAVAVSAVDAAAVDAVVSVAYDAALTLVGQRLAGSSGRYSAIDEGWKRVLPACAKHLARAPERVVAAVSNALHSLAASGDGGAGSGARSGEWIDAMERVAPQCPDVESLLQAGQVAAWHAGLAHFREGALAVAAKLPAPLANLALSTPYANTTRDASQGSAGEAAPTTPRARGSGAPAIDLAQLLTRLSQDIWFNPSAPGDSRALRLTREVGSFRGYGGLFRQPPQIAARDGGWLVSSADDVWFLTADAFGATFHRATKDEWGAGKHDTQLPSGARLSGQTLKHGGESITLPISGPITSAATSGNTLALTSAHTHTILFVALGSA